MTSKQRSQVKNLKKKKKKKKKKRIANVLRPLFFEILSDPSLHGVCGIALWHVFRTCRKQSEEEGREGVKWELIRLF